MNSINHIIKTFAINANISESMILRIHLILSLFNEILIVTDKKIYTKILSSLDKIFSQHLEDPSKIKNFDYYFKNCNDNDSLLSRNRVIENLITFRNPNKDLLNLIQIEYMKRIVNDSKKKKSNSEIIISSINGIAAAMQTTG